jgi:hypothetical protein
MKVYLASKSKWHEFVAALGAAGLSLSASWPYWRYNREPDAEPSSEAWREHAIACVDQVSDCDVLILFVAEGEQHLGSLIECGVALGNNKQIFLISPHPWMFLRSHPNVRSFETLADAVLAVVSMQDGERLRGAA